MDRRRYKSPNNTLTVTYVRVPGTEKLPFELVYHETLGPVQGCGGIVRANSSGQIEYPRDPSRVFEGELQCDWLIFALGDQKVVRLTIPSIDMRGPTGNATACNTDYIEVRDGSSAASPLIDRFCGKSELKISVASSTNTMLIRFRSVGGTEKRSFQIKYSVEDKACGGLLVASNETQVVTSRNFPNPYEPMMRCRWHFKLPPDITPYLWRIAFNFTTLDISCDNNDLIEFSSARGTYNPTRVCDASHQTLPQLLAPNDILMTFQSGSSVVTRKGFRMEYAIADCNQTYTNPSGTIVNSLFPRANRGSGSRCFIKIQTTADRSITLYFSQLEIRENAGQEAAVGRECGESRMEIRAGTKMSDPVLETRCGSSALQSVFSSSSSLSIYVHTSARGSNLYKILYTTTDQGTGCGGNLTGFRARFTSPFFPAPYTSSVPCRWLIPSLGHHPITLTFDQLVLSSRGGCTSNYVEVYADARETESKRLARFCGDVSSLPLGCFRDPWDKSNVSV